MCVAESWALKANHLVTQESSPSYLNDCYLEELLTGTFFFFFAYGSYQSLEMIYSLRINIDKYLEEITLDAKKNEIDFSKFLRFLYDVHLPWK